MGCDYYIDVYLSAVWGRPGARERAVDVFVEQRKHYVGCYGDSDDEFDEGAYLKERCPADKALFRDGGWIITGRERVATYERLLKEAGVPLKAENLVVTKTHVMYPRA